MNNSIVREEINNSLEKLAELENKKASLIDDLTNKQQLLSDTNDKLIVARKALEKTIADDAEFRKNWAELAFKTQNKSKDFTAL